MEFRLGRLSSIIISYLFHKFKVIYRLPLPNNNHYQSSYKTDSGRHTLTHCCLRLLRAKSKLQATYIRGNKVSGWHRCPVKVWRSQAAPIHTWCNELSALIEVFIFFKTVLGLCRPLLSLQTKNKRKLKISAFLSRFFC